ncbi:MAG: hypothetical protein SP1CHLAM54_07810 [Chlamydiia bacterium]|nr:hypothetical protein [Chlamydiia bacterium]MCH9615687.1 hypothetical protein [Chlamydiia bacterium]MCH9628910.1 hypothetical protein [Chlamydiia bacterium]
MSEAVSNSPLSDVKVSLESNGIPASDIALAIAGIGALAAITGTVAGIVGVLEPILAVGIGAIGVATALYSGVFSVILKNHSPSEILSRVVRANEMQMAIDQGLPPSITHNYFIR